MKIRSLLLPIAIISLYGCSGVGRSDKLQEEKHGISADSNSGYTIPTANSVSRKDQTDEINKTQKSPSVNDPVSAIEKRPQSTTQKNFEHSGGIPSHEIWTNLMKKHVSKAGKVDYKSLIEKFKILERYCGILSENPPQDNWSNDQKLAYWINLYNAYTIKLILDNYPVKSITNLHQGKPWDYSFIPVGKDTFSLNQVEHDIIRKRYDEPRIHFALNCAAISCPKLLNEAYQASKLDDQLRQQTQYFLHNENKNKLSSSEVRISKIFDWYKEDFKKSGGIIKFLNKYSDISIDDDADIIYMDYDWQLNDNL